MKNKLKLVKLLTNLSLRDKINTNKGDKMFETHCHINLDIYDNKLKETIKEANNNGVKHILVVGMDYKTSKKAIEIANNYDNVYASVGIHPGYVNDSNHHLLNDLYNNEKVVALGEIGLDFYWTDKNKDLQLKVFEEQVKKAINLNLPIIIHTRNSFKEAYDILIKYKGKIKGVFHCFSSNLEDAKKAIDLGFYIGIDGPITFKKNNEELIKIVKETDLKHILIETDSPYLTPEPFRGKENSPKNLKYIANKIALIKNVNLEEVINITTLNGLKLFDIKGGI